MKNLDFIGFPMYAICPDGRVFSLFSNDYLSPVKTTAGYHSVTLQDWEVKKNFSVHRLVALAFIPNPECKPQVNHRDGNKVNNRIENLEWATAKENCVHAISSGLKRDFKHSYRPVSDEVVHTVCKLISENWRNCDITKATGLDRGLIAKIRFGTHYPDISKQYDFSNVESSRRKVSDAKVLKICEMLASKTPWSIIMRDLKVGYSTLTKIVKRETYTSISKSFIF